MPFLHPPYFLIRGLQHASNLNLRSPLASQDGFGERSISPDYSPPLWGIMAEDRRLSPHKEFNGPSTLSLQITVESLMQFWPDFDAALYWCGVTPQQSNKVRSQQWLSWSSWKDVSPPVCAGVQGGGWARRTVPAQSSSCLRTDRRGKARCSANSAFPVPPSPREDNPGLFSCWAVGCSIQRSWNPGLSSITLASRQGVAALGCGAGPGRHSGGRLLLRAGALLGAPGPPPLAVREG